MHVELVRTLTEDGVRLDGALSLPGDSGQGKGCRCDAIVLLHGAGGNFYSSSLLEEVARQANEVGVAALRVNTRGHGALQLASGSDGVRRQGAAYESVDDCRLDLDAWMKFLARRGHERIGLLGHSLGAVKALYQQTRQPPQMAACLVAISPPRLSFTAFKNSLASSVFFESLAAAEERVAAGRGHELIEVRFPLPLLISAAGYVDKYGRGERYNYFQFLDRVECPSLFLFASLELEQGLPAFAGAADLVSQHPAGPASREVTIIAGADHFYRGLEEDAAEPIARWLKLE